MVMADGKKKKKKRRRTKKKLKNLKKTKKDEEKDEDEDEDEEKRTKKKGRKDEWRRWRSVKKMAFSPLGFWGKTTPATHNRFHVRLLFFRSLLLVDPPHKAHDITITWLSSSSSSSSSII